MRETSPGRPKRHTPAASNGPVERKTTSAGEDRSLRQLAALAVRAARRAHAPYSGFRVGVAMRDDAGTVYLGANQENAAYPLGICAERVALRAWRVAGGGPLRDLVIHTDTDRPTPPCGLCRDALRRWAAEARVHLHCRAGLSVPRGAGDWLPASAPKPAPPPLRPPAGGPRSDTITARGPRGRRNRT